MFCKKCGTYNEEGSTVCGMCGTPFTPQAGNAPYMSGNGISTLPKKNAAPVIAAILGVFLLAAIAVIIALVVNANKPVAQPAYSSATAGASNYSTSAAATDPADDPNYDPGCPAVPEGDMPIQAEEAAAPSPYYGIFCSAYKNYDDAHADAEKLQQQGFTNAQVVYTTDWSNLNTEPWYCVIAGAYTTKSAADDALPRVKAVYSDAYVKYSGDYQAN